MASNYALKLPAAPESDGILTCAAARPQLNAVR